MQTLIANKFYQVSVDMRNVGFIQTWEIILKQVHVPNKREMWLPCFEFIWPLNSMKMPWYSAWSLLLFLFRTNGKKGGLDENTTSVTVMIMFFESGILKVTWSQLCSKFLPNNYKAHWKQHFEKTPYSRMCFGHGSTDAQHFSSRLR